MLLGCRHHRKEVFRVRRRMPCCRFAPHSSDGLEPGFGSIQARAVTLILLRIVDVLWLHQRRDLSVVAG